MRFTSRHARFNFSRGYNRIFDADAKFEGECLNQVMFQATRLS